MAYMKHLLGLVTLAGIAKQASAISFFFNGTDFANLVAARNVSAGCSTAMQGSLSCDPYLTYVMTSNYFGSLHNDTLQGRFCNATCGTQLANYTATVKKACANDPQPFDGYPATYWGDSATSAWNQMCMKDPGSGQYCSVFFENIFAASANSSTNNASWPTLLTDKQLCSNCTYNLFKQIQSTPYSNYDAKLAVEWASIQSKCSVSFPTAVPTLATNVTVPGSFAGPGLVKSGCVSGQKYTVASGDNCVAISGKQNVSTGTLIAINDLYADCSNLYAGASLCLPLTCTTYNVKSGDTCDGIANSTNTLYQQLTAWNPALGSYCSNLLSGQNICVSPPGGMSNFTTIPGATVTQTAVYATATVARPSPVASGTTLKCGKYYQINNGDNCQLVSLNNTIALSLFEAINPSINSTCGNLLLGFYYCVSPTADWNTTASSTVVTAPTTTPSGTTANCYQYYTIQSGDYCGKVEDMFAISMGQLQYWNPSLLSDCSNLALGEAYCVNGAQQPPSGSTPTASPKVKRLEGARPGATGPEKTRAPEGGVPYGWPGLKAPRLQMGVGNGKQEL